MRTTTILVVLAIAVAGCGAGPEPATGVETTTTVADTSITTETETSTMPTTEPEQLPIVTPARIDLAERLGVDPEVLEVVSAEEVTWPDGSLGCPEPGMSYTQSLVDGSKVVFGHDDRFYAYHAGDDAQPFLCPSEDRDGGHEMVPPPGFND